MRIVFEVAGDKLIEREILRVGDRVVDARPAWHAVARLFRAETRRQFATEGGWASGGWAPLANSTRARRRAGGLERSVALFDESGRFAQFSTQGVIGGGRIKILDETGALKRSLTQPGDPNEVYDARPDELVFGSKLPYAAFHQRGTSRMPRRRPLEFTEQARRNTVRIVQRFVITGEVEA